MSGYVTDSAETLATQAAYDAGHDRSDHHCLSDPCSWHPGEQRIRPRPAYPATLAEVLGALPEAYNVFDHTDEATTMITAPVDLIAQALIASGAVRPAAEVRAETLREYAGVVETYETGEQAAAAMRVMADIALRVALSEDVTP